MRRTYALIAVAATVLVLVGAGAWLLFVPPAATGTPQYQPYQVEPDAPASNYRVVTNATLRCRNATWTGNPTRTANATMAQVTRVDLAAGVRRSHRVVRTANGTFTYSEFQNGSTRFERSTTATGSPAYERDAAAGDVEPELHYHLPVYPRLLRFEWRAVANGSGRTVFRPRAGYWVAPATRYGVRNRLFVASAEGRLVTTDDGALRNLSLSAETVRATNRFQRYVGPRRRCDVRLGYRFRPARDPVGTPGWVDAANLSRSPKDFDARSEP